jgi:Fe2+ or Zn2+ uptake regulation protein
MMATDIKQLRLYGYRLTPQRLAILNVLRQAHGHVTPAELCKQLRINLPGLNEATVYRTLNFLTAQGLVFAAHIGHGQLVYELADHDHHHLICRSCGGTQEVDHRALSNLYDVFLEQTGYQIDTIHATFFGLCPTCQKLELNLEA